jgi:L-lactate dehydrogenase (cytochrome)
VDAPGFGRREKDMRLKSISLNSHMQKGTTTKRDQGYAKSLSSFIDPSLNWSDIAWFRSITKMPIILKGIQCSEDALLAVHHGCDGIILSNHGGRQLDFARSGIEILAEVMDALRINGYENKLEVWIDGGIRRGSDIFKALALGAKAVGIGRPMLYGLASYGQEGVERVIEMFKEELENTMRLMGTPTLKDILPSMVITKNLSEHYSPVPTDFLSSNTYQSVPLARSSKL